MYFGEKHAFAKMLVTIRCLQVGLSKRRKYACWVTEDADIKWSDDACMAADVKEAIAQMVFDIGV